LHSFVVLCETNILRLISQSLDNFYQIQTNYCSAHCSNSGARNRDLNTALIVHSIVLLPTLGVPLEPSVAVTSGRRQHRGVLLRPKKKDQPSLILTRFIKNTCNIYIFNKNIIKIYSMVYLVVLIIYYKC
jgi:hypothetical protein